MSPSSDPEHQSKATYRPTAEQQRWWRRLTRVIKEMPGSVELLVDSGGINLARAGDADRYFDTHGHFDNVETMLIEKIKHGRIRDVTSNV